MSRIVPQLGFLFLLLSSPALAQTLHLKADSAQLSGPNLHLQADDYSAAGNSLHGAGRGYISGFRDDGDHAVFKFKVRSAGLYKLSIAFHSSSRRGYEIKVNGLEIAGTILPTPSDAFLLEPVGTVELDAGQNTVDIGKGWGYFEVDFIELSPVALPIEVPSATDKAADPQLTAEAQALLARLKTAYGASTLVGVYSDADAKYTLDHTGVRPSIMGGDLLAYSPQEVKHGTHPEKGGDTERLMARAKDGYIITLSWHWCSPTGLMDSKEKPWWRGFYTDSTHFDIEKTLADPASDDYATMLRDIDTIAVQLRRLQDAHIPVLWRPLHEASGGWFWWGAKGAKPYVQLWRLLYDRLTVTDGIHNLIWVYTGDGDAAWYPGDAYVDVVGIDAYPKDLRDPQSQVWENLQRSVGSRKLVAISEFGGVPDLPRMQRMGEFWSYAVSWSGKEGPMKNTPEELKRIYASPGVGSMPPPVQTAPVEPAGQP